MNGLYLVMVTVGVKSLSKLRFDHVTELTIS